MESFSSRMYTSPSFNTHSSNHIAAIADRVVHELRTQNHDEQVFTFSDDEEEREFEFPVSTDDVISDEQISLRYPVFDRSLLSPVTEAKPKPPRPSLKQLLSEDRDPPSTEDLNGVAPGTYCVWKPNTNKKKEPPRGKHKKSSSVSVDNNNNNNNNNISKRWKVRDLLKRSYSDDSYTNTTGKESPVVVFLPPMSPNKVVKSGKVERNIPAYKAKKKIGNIRIPPHYHFRQGQLANGTTTKQPLPLLNV